MKKPALKLMPDYQCFPLWRVGGTEAGNVDPAEIGLSEDLRRDMGAWTALFESHLDMADPSSCVWLESEEDEFDQIGLSLWQRIKSEVGDRYSVSYHGRKIKKDEA